MNTELKRIILEQIVYFNVKSMSATLSTRLHLARQREDDSLYLHREHEGNMDL